MGSYLRYRCPRCGFAAEIGGPAEFYLAGTEPRVYGHPEPVRAEGAARGVDGFWMELWCDGCRAVKRVVTMAFETPCDPLDAWSGRGTPRAGYPAEAGSCPDCAERLIDELPGLPPLCPACRGGPLDVGRGDG